MLNKSSSGLLPTTPPKPNSLSLSNMLVILNTNNTVFKGFNKHKTKFYCKFGKFLMQVYNLEGWNQVGERHGFPTMKLSHTFHKEFLLSGNEASHVILRNIKYIK
jgi:hypothetical protein